MALAHTVRPTTYTHNLSPPSQVASETWPRLERLAHNSYTLGNRTGNKHEGLACTAVPIPSLPSQPWPHQLRSGPATNLLGTCRARPSPKGFVTAFSGPAQGQMFLLSFPLYSRGTLNPE